MKWYGSGFDLPSRTLKPMSFQSRAAGGGGNIAGVDQAGAGERKKREEQLVLVFLSVGGKCKSNSKL